MTAPPSALLPETREVVDSAVLTCLGNRRFSGDESFKGSGGVGGLLSVTDAGLSMGVVVEGRGKGGSKKDGGDGGAGPRL